MGRRWRLGDAPACQLGFDALADLLAAFTVLAGQILLGLVVFGLGVYLADLAAGAVRASGVRQADVLALATRAAVLVLAGAMALRQMGLANEIVNLAFGLLLGAIAVAAALAFGLGGRNVAGRYLEEWTTRLEARTSAPYAPAAPPSTPTATQTSPPPAPPSPPPSGAV
jgi:cytochrome bd-type quinol oxidase subunit 2